MIFVKFGFISATSILMALVLVTFSCVGIFQISTAAVKQLLIIPPVCLLLLSIAYHYVLYAKDFVKTPQKMTKVGFHFFGGVVGVFLGVFWVSRSFELPYLLLCDATALFVSLCHGISRIACLNYGCCHGRPLATAVKWKWPYALYTCQESKAIRVSQLQNVKLYPTQCYELVGNFVIQFILLVCLFYYSANYRLGLTIGLYMTLYGLLRFFCEYHRGEVDNKYAWGLSTNQWMALAFAFIGLAVLLNLGLSGTWPITPVPKLAIWSAVFQFWPYFVAAPVLTLLAYGLHYKEVGAWVSMSPDLGMSTKTVLER